MKSKAYAIIDQSDKPIIRVTFTGEKSTNENFQQYLDDLASCYEVRKSIAIIFDASQAATPNLSHQKTQAVWISQHWKTIQTYCKGTAYVIPNLAIRAVLKMIFSFQNQPVPYQVFSNTEAAENWIEEISSKEK